MATHTMATRREGEGGGEAHEGSPVEKAREDVVGGVGDALLEYNERQNGPGGTENGGVHR
eukprot:CAMPEP_0198650524 /NCGR_PEP_ID=MMETSP1467-20131203/5039_1 /TAXON_ID=1462469 /ORGANISM="unid. sp., Strain CCMP2135" /LENGTH=59 /DNA_ID=CAMNT_0044386379 /DNA_START=53 /DNA_END=229 /DNA_ORIENTATION=+